MTGRAPSLPIEAEFVGHFPLPGSVAGPTARSLAVDVSRGAARASGGYRAWDGAQVTVMPECECACGGRLVAESRADADIRAAVEIHNVSAQHTRWREAVEL